MSIVGVRSGFKSDPVISFSNSVLLFNGYKISNRSRNNAINKIYKISAPTHNPSRLFIGIVL